MKNVFSSTECSFCSNSNVSVRSLTACLWTGLVPFRSAALLSRRRRRRASCVVRRLCVFSLFPSLPLSLSLLFSSSSSVALRARNVAETRNAIPSQPSASINRILREREYGDRTTVGRAWGRQAPARRGEKEKRVDFAWCFSKKFEKHNAKYAVTPMCFLEQMQI